MAIEIGYIIHAPEDARRDAIHVAVFPAKAGVTLKPGDRISLDSDGEAFLPSLGRPKAVAMVDPFLTAPVDIGQYFWAFMLPNTVTNLRHQWSLAGISDDAEENYAGDEYDECRGCY